jgi:maltooligosyltrehalose trehalohydrolase
MTAQWADDVHHALHALLTGERHGYYVDFGSPEVLRTTLTEVFLHSGTYSTFRGQTWGHRVPDDVDGHRFVVFSTDHDQVGNRALGDRPGRPARPGEGEVDLDLLAASAAVVLTSAFTPMLFMGEEWGASTPWPFFSSHPEPELAEATRTGRIAEFSRMGWDPAVVPDPQDPATFASAKLDWSEPAEPDHARLLAWYRRLIELRRAVPADARATCVGYSDGVFAFTRGRLRVEVALGGPLPDDDAEGRVLAAFGDTVRVTPASRAADAGGGD